MKYFVYQGNNHDCGFAALKIFLANLAKDKSFLYIPKPSKREYYNLNDITRISEDYGVPLESYTCSKEYYGDLESPSLTLIDENHMVMVKKRKRRKIILYDPEKGKLVLKKDEFLRRWKCVLLTTNYPNEVPKIKKIRQHILPLKLVNLENIFAVISSVILIGSFYLLNKSENFIYSLLFLGIFIIFQILEKFILYKQVYIFDNNYIPKYFDVKKNCSKEGYEKYIDFKRHFFTTNREMLASILTAFVITFLLCLNDFRNVFVLLTLILTKLLEIILFSKKEQESKNKIAELESGDFSEPHLAKDFASGANNIADAHIFFNAVKEVFYIFISFALSIAMLFVTENVGCNYVIFHFVMYLMGFNSYNQVILGLSDRKNNQRLERQFFDSCNL